MQFSGAALPDAYQCWVLPCLCPSLVLQSPLLPMDFTSSWCERTCCGLVSLPALSNHVKKPNKLSTFQNLPTKNQKTPLHRHLSNHVGFVGTFLTAITETLDSAPEQQNLLSLAPRSNQTSVYFIAPINFLLTVLEVCEEERREREKKKKKTVQECRLGKVPAINGVAATSGYLKIHQCQVPGGFCCLWQLVIIIGRLLQCTS